MFVFFYFIKRKKWLEVGGRMLLNSYIINNNFDVEKKNTDVATTWE